jgi:DNA-binding Lrp family transcriptional regulator
MFLTEKSAEKLNELGKSSPSALRIYLSLCRYNGPTVFSSQSLGDLVGLSSSTVSTAIRLLEESGVISTYRVGTAYVCTILDRGFSDMEWSTEDAGDVNALHSWAIISNEEQPKNKAREENEDNSSFNENMQIEEKMNDLFPQIEN